MIVLLGLDCLEPSFAFERYADAMPFLTEQRRAATAFPTAGTLRSSTPPITVPAWASMMTGKDPGELGLYGFRNRIAGSYALSTVTSLQSCHETLTAQLARQGQKTASLFVPPSPPHATQASWVTGCFLNGASTTYASPVGFRDELQSHFGTFLPDVDDDGDLGQFGTELFRTGRYRFDVLRWVLAKHRPALTCFVDIGPDRLHHRCFRAAENGDRAERELVFDYYAFLDEQCRGLCEAYPSATFVIVSDHGAQTCKGGFYLNQWLRDGGYLTLKNPQFKGVPAASDIDWSQTLAWAEGGYYGRVMINTAGREPQGIVPTSGAESLQIELAQAIRMIDADHLVTAHSPHELYRSVQGLPPDLLVAADNYATRILGSVAPNRNSYFCDYVGVEQEPGRHGCNHAPDGLVQVLGPDRGTIELPTNILGVRAFLLSLLRR